MSSRRRAGSRDTAADPSHGCRSDFDRPQSRSRALLGARRIVAVLANVLAHLARVLLAQIQDQKPAFAIAEPLDQLGQQILPSGTIQETAEDAVLHAFEAGVLAVLRDP